MPSDVVSFRMDAKMQRDMNELVQKRVDSQSDIIRKAVQTYVAVEKERDELKQLLGLKFAEGKISFDELVRLLGFEEAKKTAYFVEIAEKSFSEGL